jgi:hypothetical protein
VTQNFVRYNISSHAAFKYAKLLLEKSQTCGSSEQKSKRDSRNIFVFEAVFL